MIFLLLQQSNSSDNYPVCVFTGIYFEVLKVERSLYNYVILLGCKIMNLELKNEVKLVKEYKFRNINKT